MLRERVAQMFDDRAEDGRWWPAYEDYCFSNVPETALSVLDDRFERRLPLEVFDGVETDVDNVILFLLDGFGYEHWLDTATASRFSRHSPTEEPSRRFRRSIPRRRPRH